MRCGFVCSEKTGEIIYEFTPMQVFMGTQYMNAWAVGRYYTIVNTEKSRDKYIIWVR